MFAETSKDGSAAKPAAKRPVSSPDMWVCGHLYLSKWTVPIYIHNLICCFTHSGKAPVQRRPDLTSESLPWPLTPPFLWAELWLNSTSCWMTFLLPRRPPIPSSAMNRKETADKNRKMFIKRKNFSFPFLRNLLPSLDMLVPWTPNFQLYLKTHKCSSEAHTFAFAVNFV